MLYSLGLITRYAALASAGITRVSLDHNAVTVSGSSSSRHFLLIAGAIGLLVILGVIVAVILFVRHKQALSGDGDGGRPGTALFNTRPGYGGYGQDYGRMMMAAEQEPWPWARKPVQPIKYNPVTPIPEMLKTPAIPMTPLPEVPAAPVVPMQNAVERPPVLVPDPALEGIMRQVQVGLFAMHAQYKGQRDREAVL